MQILKHLQEKELKNRGKKFRTRARKYGKVGELWDPGELKLKETRTKGKEEAINCGGANWKD